MTEKNPGTIGRWLQSKQAPVQKQVEQGPPISGNTGRTRGLRQSEEALNGQKNVTGTGTEVSLDGRAMAIPPNPRNFLAGAHSSGQDGGSQPSQAAGRLALNGGSVSRNPTRIAGSSMMRVDAPAP